MNFNQVIIRSLLLFIAFNFPYLSPVKAQPPELVLPFGHAKQVLNITYSKDGKYIATTAEDNNVIIWDAYTAKSIHLLSGHVNKVNSIDFSSDGNYVVTGSEDTQVSLWNTRSGKLLYSLASQENAVVLVQFSPDSKLVLVCCADGKSFLWDMISEKEAFLLQKTPINYKPGIGLMDNEAIRRASFSANGEYVFIQNNTGLLRVFKVSDGNSLITCNTTAPNMLLFASQVMAKFTPDGEHLLIMKPQESLLFDLKKKDSVIQKNKYSEGIINYDFFSNGDSVIAVDQFGFIIKWNIHDGNITVLKQPDKFAFYYQAEFNFKQNMIITAGGDSTISFWSMTSGLFRNSQKAGSILNIEVSPNGFLFAVNELYKDVQIQKFPDGKILALLKAHNNYINQAVLDETNDHLLTSSNDETIKIWSLSKGKILQVVKGIDATDCKVKISSGHRYFYTWYSNIVQVFDASKGTSLLNLGGGNTFDMKKATFDLITNVEMSNDERYIAASSSDHSIKIWEINTGRKVYSFVADDWPITSLNFSPDSRYIAGVSSLGKIAIWNVTNGILVDSIKTRAFDGNFYFSFSSNKICTETIDGKIIVYDIMLKKIIAQFIPAEKDDFSSAKFSVNDRFLITNGQFQSTVWDIKTAKKIVTINQETYSIINGIISNTNKEVFVVTSDGNCHIYNLPDGKETGNINFGGYSIPDLDQVTEENFLATSNSSVHIYNITNDKDIVFSPIDRKDYVIKSNDSWYTSTPDAARWLSWKFGEKVYDFDQWDFQYNRPDKVLEDLGNQDTALIGAYQKAYLKRIRKMQLDTSMFKDDHHVPEIEIQNLKQVEGLSETSTVSLKIRCYETDKSNTLKKLFVTVNGNPLYGANGMDIKGTNKTDVQFDLPVALNSGTNAIKVSCMNNRAAESLRETVYINYEPALPVKSTTYYIGIGVSKYKDSSYNLHYADKDVTDISNSLQQKYPNAVLTLLTNEKATIENIKAIKRQLLNSKPDDKVIISFSGHGLIDKNYDFYFATYDIDFKNPLERGLSYDDIEWLLDSIPSRNKLVLMDACHSGELDKEGSYTVDTNSHPGDNNVKEVKGIKVTKKDSLGFGLNNTFELMQDLFANIGRGNGATIISAAAGTEFAFEGNNWANGVFTYTVLQGLTQNKADINKDNETTITELQQYVSEQVEKLTNGRQRPTSRQTNFDNDWKIW